MADDVEQIAVLTGRGVDPFARRARWSKTHPHRTTLRAVDVAYRPVPSGAASGGEVLPADLLGALGERRGKGGEIAMGVHAQSRPFATVRVDPGRRSFFRSGCSRDTHGSGSNGSSWRRWNLPSARTA